MAASVTHQAVVGFRPLARSDFARLQAAPGFYSRHGDLLPQASVLFSLILLALAFLRKKRGI
jgi:hypothetical protein